MFAPTERPAPTTTEREPVNFGALLTMLDTELGTVPSHIIKSFKFDLNGMNIDIRRIAHETGFRFLVTACLGYLPFSIESVERRQAIKTIVSSTKSLPTVHFTIDHTSKIIAGGLFEVGSGIDPAFFFYPLTLFLQEARPFMQLIGQYLYMAPQTA